MMKLTNHGKDLNNKLSLSAMMVDQPKKHIMIHIKLKDMMDISDMVIG